MTGPRPFPQQPPAMTACWDCGGSGATKYEVYEGAFTLFCPSCRARFERMAHVVARLSKTVAGRQKLELALSDAGDPQ